MDIENEIFKRTKVNFDSLIPYGFVKEKDKYIYTKIFMNNFKVNIVITDKGIVKGKIYDLNFDDEYTCFRIKNQTLGFACTVREEYQKILKDIKKHCFEKIYFINNQANRIARKIKDIYNDEPEFIWDKFPGYGIFRNPNNKKWYGLIMNIDKSKIDKKTKGKVEVINLKLDVDKIPNLLKKKGFYNAYHMNKQNWVTIVLDDTIADEEIIKYVICSHKYTEKSNEWIIPANPKYYDVIKAFNDNNIITWKQSNNIQVGDIVYIYVTSPYSAILFKCQAIEVNIPYEYKDDNISMKFIMKIKLLEKYDKDKYSLSKLNKYGIKAVRGPRKMPENFK